MIYTDDSDVRVIRTALLRHFDVHTALFLTQLDYLLDHSVSIHDGYHWTYRTYQEWEDDLGLSRSTIQRIVRRLKQQGIVICGCFNRFRYDRTTWFRLDYEALRLMGLEIRHICTGEKAIQAMERVEQREKRAAQKAFTVSKRVEHPPIEADRVFTADDVDDGFDFQNSTARLLVPELQQKVLRQHCGKKAGKV